MALSGQVAGWMDWMLEGIGSWKLNADFRSIRASFQFLFSIFKFQVQLLHSFRGPLSDKTSAARVFLKDGQRNLVCGAGAQSRPSGVRVSEN